MGFLNAFQSLFGFKKSASISERPIGLRHLGIHNNAYITDDDILNELAEPISPGPALKTRSSLFSKSAAPAFARISVGQYQYKPLPRKSFHFISSEY